MVRDRVAIVFYPEKEGALPAMREWQRRNPDWRQPLPDVITCPVCGIAVRAIADLALLDPAQLREEIARFRDAHLRAACSEHHLPTEEEWAVMGAGMR